MMKACYESIISEGKIVKKRQPEENTFGWRLMKARTDRQMSQNDVIDRLAKYKSKDMPRSVPALSQLEIGETKRVHVDLLLALCKILDVSAEYLITGVEAEKPTAWSEEAEKLASMVDSLSPRARRLLLDGAHMLKQVENEILENHREIARLLEENINLLSADDRKIAAEHIASIRHLRNVR